MFKDWFGGTEKIMPIDINRIIRYAILKGSHKIVSYLSEHHNADLTARGVRGRSASFYAVFSDSVVYRSVPGYHSLSTGGANMLKYIAEETRDTFQEEMRHRDVFGNSPVSYAVLFQASVEPLCSV